MAFGGSQLNGGDRRSKAFRWGNHVAVLPGPGYNIPDN
jgi:hypothetical protein